MRDFVIDADVLMSILISGKASYRQILRFYNFVLADFALIEIDKYREVIIAKTKKSDDELIMWTASYVALAMQLDLVLLTRDVPLYKGLKKLGFRKVTLFEEFLRMQ